MSATASPASPATDRDRAEPAGATGQVGAQRSGRR